MLCLYATFPFSFLVQSLTWKEKLKGSDATKDSHPVNNLLAGNLTCFATLGFSTGKS